MAYSKSSPKSGTKSAPGARFDALSVREYEAGGETKSAWLRIGTAFQNDDGSFKVLLQALPVDGVIHLRKPLPPKE